MSLSVDAVGLHEVALGVGVGAPRALNETLTRWGVRSFRVHLPSLAYDLGHGDVEAHETAPIAMELGRTSPPSATRPTRSREANARAAGRARRARRTAPALGGAALELAASSPVYDAFAPRLQAPKCG